MNTTAAASSSELGAVSELIVLFEEFFRPLVGGDGDLQIVRPPTVTILDGSGDKIGRLRWQKWRGYGFESA